ncbi:hypothetical protein B0H12DRAFT_1079416 [Mycena haematopus]|nr:hypothetical protein B0H12DRAFT_1079416 [Mycena haematopus]
MNSIWIRSMVFGDAEAPPADESEEPPAPTATDAILAQQSFGFWFSADDSIITVAFRPSVQPMLRVTQGVHFFKCSFLSNHSKITIKGNPGLAGREILPLFSLFEPQNLDVTVTNVASVQFIVHSFPLRLYIDQEFLSFPLCPSMHLELAHDSFLSRTHRHTRNSSPKIVLITHCIDSNPDLLCIGR